MASQGTTSRITVGRVIDRATAPELIGPDWSANLECTDLLNQGSAETAQEALRAFRSKLKSNNPKVLQLTMTLLETCMKNAEVLGENGVNRFHALVGTREFLELLAQLGDGKQGWDVKEQALSLIQQWGLAFQSKQDTLMFYQVYMDMRLRGVGFPPLEKSSPIFTPPQTSPPTVPGASGIGGIGGGGGGGEGGGGGGQLQPSAQQHQQQQQEGRGGGSGSSAEAKEEEGGGGGGEDAEEAAEIAKLVDDLKEVSERARLCREMLPNSSGIETDDALAEAIGFLEACKPRLVEVIEAGMAGGLSAELLEQALETNDEVLKVLEAEKNGSSSNAGRGGEEKETAAGGGGGATDDLLDFGAVGAPPPPSYDEATLKRPIATHPPSAEEEKEIATLPEQQQQKEDSAGGGGGDLLASSMEGLGLEGSSSNREEG